MNYLTHQLLNTEELKELHLILSNKDLIWEDGRKTAGTYASKVKNNIQLSRESEVSKNFTKFIIETIIIPKLNDSIFDIIYNTKSNLFEGSNLKKDYNGIYRSRWGDMAIVSIGS